MRVPIGIAVVAVVSYKLYTRYNMVISLLYLYYVHVAPSMIEATFGIIPANFI